jgi:hypothetical protein
MSWMHRAMGSAVGAGRQRRGRRSWTGLGATLLACLLAAGTFSTARATVMVEVALEDMIRDSVAIVRGRVIHSGTHMLVREHGMDPATVTTLRVDEWLKGEGGPTLSIRELGGLIGPTGQGGGMRIDGTPQYALGEEVLVFLAPDPDDATYFRTYAMAQGKFVVLRGVGGAPDVVTRDTATVAFARWARGRMTLHHGNREVLPLDSFVELVRGVQTYFPSEGGVLEGGAR